ncbi:MAG TPA: glycerate kinase [Mycobacteriales bacterium]|nr:glycerate kinase [Mycobacteriales bacterium]
MRVVVAPDSFSGSLTAAQAAAAIVTGWHAARPADVLTSVPVADGGEGTVAVVAAATRTRPTVTTVADPFGRPVEAQWLLLAGGTAVVELAAASGLWRLSPSERDPRRTTTYGTGELIRAALDAGARTVVVGLGGSATNDGGAGLLQALGARLLDADGRELERGGAALARLDRVDSSGLDPRLPGVEVLAATDVDSPLTGPAGASAVFGPQKGANVDDVALLDAALASWAWVVMRDVPGCPDLLGLPGGGAAGGTAAGLVAMCGARVASGASTVLGLVALHALAGRADLLVTGEGSLDAQSVRGKAPVAVAALARDLGVACIALCGQVALGRQQLATAGFAAAYAVADVAPSNDDAVADAAVWLAELAGQAAREWSR